MQRKHIRLVGLLLSLLFVVAVLAAWPVAAAAPKLKVTFGKLPADWTSYDSCVLKGQTCALAAGQDASAHKVYTRYGSVFDVEARATQPGKCPGSSAVGLDMRNAGTAGQQTTLGGYSAVRFEVDVEVKECKPGYGYLSYNVLYCVDLGDIWAEIGGPYTSVQCDDRSLLPGLKQEVAEIIGGLRLGIEGGSAPTTQATRAPTASPGCKATINLPSGLRPGDTFSPSATVTGSDGKTPQGAYSYVWYLNGVETSSIVWDGKRVKVELQVSCENMPQSLHTAYPAYGAPPGLSGIGAIPGPESLPQGIIGIVLPGLISIIGGALAGIAGGGRPTIPLPGASSPGVAAPGTPAAPSPGGERPSAPLPGASSPGVAAPGTAAAPSAVGGGAEPAPDGMIKKGTKAIDDGFEKIDEIGEWHDNLKTAIENMPISPGLRDKLDKLNDMMDKTREVGDSLKDAWETAKDPLGLVSAKEKLDALKKAYEDLGNSYDEYKGKNKDLPSGVGNRVAGVQSILETAGGAAGDYISENVSEGLGKDVKQAGKDAANTVRGATDWNLGSEKWDKELDEKDRMSDRPGSIYDNDEYKDFDRQQKAKQAGQKQEDSYWGKAWKWLYPDVTPGVEKFR